MGRPSTTTASIPTSSYTRDLPWGGDVFTRVVDADRVFAEYQAGATIVLQALHRSWLPLGLFCRDLKSKGYSYVAAIDYWRLHGQPNQMDADRNGVPCETVYPRSDIGQYWNGREISGATPLATGLLCRDLAARGATYAQAVAYWWYYNRPLRMDADKNGIPCETVYSVATVNSFWYQ